MKKTSLILVLLIGLGVISYAQTVTIGTQVWMTKNLDVTTFRNGDPIPEAKTDEEWEKAADNYQPAWCYYKNDPANGVKYGKLYNWFAVNDSRGLAPIGYHIPSDAEWTKLTDFLGGEKAAGKKMTRLNEWEVEGKDISGTNESGFSGLMGSYRYFAGWYGSVGYEGYWWSSTMDEWPRSWYRTLSRGSGSVGRESYFRGNGFSVRCLCTLFKFEEWTTDHVILPVKQTDVAKRGLKGPVTYFDEETLKCWKGDYGFSKSEILKEIIEYDFNGKLLSYEKHIDQRKFQKFDFKLDKNGIIHKADVSDPYSNKHLSIEFYKYDSQGNVTATRMEDNMNGRIDSETLKDYNENGELIEDKRTENEKVVFWEKYERSAGKMNIQDMLNGDYWIGELNEKGDIVRLFNKEKNQTQDFAYVYDTWGNWTSRIKYLNGEQVQEVRRSIRYETYAERMAIQTPIPVKVGKQVWMSENLNVKIFNNGDLIEQAQSNSSWIKALEEGTPAWCYCEDLDGNLTKDVLYNYFALTDPRGLAPKEYRIATLEDWNSLFKKYGGLEGAFEKLKDFKRDKLNTADMRGYRSGVLLLPESYWWTKDGKKIGLAVDDIGTMLIEENVNDKGYYKDGLLIRCVKE